MRLEYNEEQEKQLRITEIESILENNLYNTEIEKFTLDAELQFLQGSEDGYKTPIAFIKIETGESLEITYKEESEQYSMLIHDVDGNPMLPYYNADTVEELLMEVIESKSGVKEIPAEDKIYKFESMGLKIEGTQERMEELANSITYEEGDPSHSLADIVSAIETAFNMVDFL